MTRLGWIISGIALTGGVGAIFLFRKDRPKDQSSDGVGGSGVWTVDNQTTGHITEPNWENPFHPGYMSDVIKWVKPKRIIKFIDDYALKLARALKKTKGRYWISRDNEKAVGTLFSKTLKDKVHVSNVAAAFLSEYKMELLPFLKSYLNTDEMERYVYKPVRQLPNYRESNKNDGKQK